MNNQRELAEIRINIVMIPGCNYMKKVMRLIVLQSLIFKNKNYYFIRKLAIKSNLTVYIKKIIDYTWKNAFEKSNLTDK